MRRMLVAAIFLLAGNGGAYADRADDCVNSKVPEQRVGACTWVIRSGNWSGAKLSWAYVNRGLAYDQMRDYESAVDDFTQALLLDPENHRAYNNRANSNRKLGRNRATLSDIENAIIRSPNDYQGYMIRGFANAALGNVRRAHGDWDIGFRIGGARVIKLYQNWMKSHGHYAGAIDGKDGPGTRRALEACARNPHC